jgi:HlyD family secretion protein
MTTVETTSERVSRSRSEVEAVPALARGLTPTARLQRRRSRLRLLKRGLALLVALAALVGLFVAWLPEHILVDEVFVRRGAMHVTVDEDGRTRVKDRYLVSSPLLATSARIELHPGHPIEEGGLLARLMPLEPALLDVRTQAQAERRVASAVAGRKQAESAVARARALREYASAETARQRELSRTGATAERALENAEVQERTAREELASAEFALRVAGYEVEMAKLTLTRQSGATDLIDAIELASPVAGQVLRVIQESAGVVQPGTPLLELGDVRALEVVADVLTSDAVHIRPMARAWIERWGGESSLHAHVRSIEPSAFTRVSALGVEEQRVNVILDLDDEHERWAALGDGYRVEVRILTWQADDVLVVPESALFRRNDRWAAFVVNEGRAQVAYVEVGHRNGELAEVLGGLTEGQAVIAHPSDRVAVDVRVAARDDDTTEAFAK